MDDPLCRVTIQCAGDGRARDLMVPRHARLELLLPDIVDLVTGDRSAPRLWRLDRLDGTRCDESASLADGAVRDGDVLVLSGSDAPTPGRSHRMYSAF
jgi:hypothetical protein